MGFKEKVGAATLCLAAIFTGAACNGDANDHAPKQAASVSCPPQYKSSDWNFMRETYMVGATKVNEVIEKDENVPYAPFEVRLPSQGAADELEKLNEVFGEFVRQGKLPAEYGALGADIGKAQVMAEKAEENALKGAACVRGGGQPKP